MLNIPIQHVGGTHGRQKYKEVRLDNSYHWQRQHWRTLQTAYRTSPFFEYYEDELAPLYEGQFKFLLDFNLAAISILCECLQLEMPLEKTTSYEPAPSGILDARFLINAKSKALPFGLQYHQLFGDRHGFIPNLSTLDLLFNMGPAALSALQQIVLNLGHE